MCSVSAVFDQWRPYIPEPNKVWPQPYIQPQVIPNTQTPIVIQQQVGLTPEELTELKEFLDAFRKAVDAAKVFDRITGQPDCEDPEKAQIEKRVEELERRLQELEDE